MKIFPSVEEIHKMLEDISQEVPKPFYNQLSGGITLDEDIKYHPNSQLDRPLYVLGEYRNLNIGRSIVIYYGSLKRAYSYETEDYIYEKLKETLLHEFTHHLESLAGKDDLGIEDRIKLDEYKKGIIDSND